MKGKGTFGTGGIGTSGGVSANIQLENGENWTFVGPVIGIDAGFGVAAVQGDFPGYDHMAGTCGVIVSGGVAGPGAFSVEWKDSHGLIGQVSGSGAGAALTAAGGFGGWIKN